MTDMLKDDTSEWKGMTLDEIRVKRIVNIAKIEIEETRLKHLAQGMSGKTSLIKGNSLVGKALGALDYVDYGVLAFKIGKKIFSIFRHRRK